MTGFDRVVLSAIRGGGFEAELLNETGYGGLDFILRTLQTLLANGAPGCAMPPGRAQ